MSDGKRTCVACRNDLQDGTTVCLICKSPQTLKLCNTCGKAVPGLALLCNDCKTFQHWWRKRVQLWSIQAAWLSAIFALISAGFAGLSYVNDHMSHTTIRVTSSTNDVIHLQVWNSGLRPSMLVGFRLIFDDRPGKEVTLDLKDQNQAGSMMFIAAGQQTPVDVNRAMPRSERRYGDAELRELLCGPAWANRRVALQVDVQESIDPWCPWNLFRPYHTRVDDVPAGRISDFIESWGLNGPCR
jgi:hypothetical protein